jgi:hypothetical protein
MFVAPPSMTKTHWVYDDPSGVAEPSPYLRPWRRRLQKRTAQLTVVRSTQKTASPIRVRVTHQEN